VPGPERQRAGADGGVSLGLFELDEIPPRGGQRVLPRRLPNVEMGFVKGLRPGPDPDQNERESEPQPPKRGAVL